MSVIRTKLGAPPLPPWHLSRTRLLERLGEEAGPPLVLVSAPAGYGKTSLLAEWARSRRFPTAWLSLDRGDDDPLRLAAGIEAALVDAARRAGDPGTEPAPVPADEAEPVARIVDLLVGMEGAALVLDDAHLLKSRTALALLADLVERLPEGRRLVLAARSDPSLPLARLRAAGRLGELRAPELRLGASEAAELARRLGAPELGPEGSALLESRTEGWAAGLSLASRCLAARAAAGGRAAALALLRDARAAHRWALDYLLEEVLSRVDPEVEDFLLRCSVLELLSAPLAEAVAGRPAPGGSLAAVAREALFLSPTDEGREWWRFHPLFSQLLLARLREARPGLERDLRLAAAGWLEGAGQPEAAADQLLAAGEAGRAARLVEAAAEEMMGRGELDALLRRVEALPPEALAERPSLRRARAWCLFFRGRPLAEFAAELAGGDAEVFAALAGLYRGRMEGLPERMGELLRAGPEGALSETGRYLAGLVSALALYEGGREGEADELLAGLRGSGSPMIRFGAGLFLATRLFREGELGKAAAILEADIAAAGPGLPAIGRHHALAGEILLYRGRLDEAEDALIAAVDRLERLGAASAMSALLLLALLRALRGEEAGNLLTRAGELARDFDIMDLDDRSVALCEARIARLRGDLAKARRILESLPALPEDPEAAAFMERHPVKYERLEKAYILVAERRWAPALEAAERIRKAALEAGRRLLLVDLDLVRSLALDGLGRSGESLSALEACLRRAAPESVILPFLRCGEARELLARRLRDLPPDLRPFAAEAAGIRSEGAEGEARPSGGGIGLSAREEDVLGFLAADLSAAEIGERLYLSENTVKTHLKSLYAKLGAHSRAAAWARALELGLTAGGPTRK